MPIKDYKFVSPGVQIKEVDQSILPTTPQAIGPVIIGKFSKGPAFIPTIVQETKDLREIFGGIITGQNVPGDVWRSGNSELAPSYASIAAEAHLDAAVSPVTIVRMLGLQHSEADSNGKAGWKVGSPTTSVSTNAGAYALVVAELTGSTGTTFNGFLSSSFVGAIFYVANGGNVILKGSPLSGSGEISGSSVWVKAKNSVQKLFTAEVVDSSGNSKGIDFSLDQNNPVFIRKGVFNTNPTNTNSECVSVTENYWLGETYEKFISDSLTVNAGVTNNLAAALVPLKSVNDLNPENFEFPAQYSKSGWIFSQHLGTTSSFANTAAQYLSSDSTVNKIVGNTKKLFRFVSISKGESEQRNYKILIENIVGPSTLEKYGTFDVSICTINSTDSSLNRVENFERCSLDVSSPDFIGRKIGDRYVEWDYNEQRLLEYGEYDNNSSIIRVEIAEGIVNGQYGEGLLPFGFYGPPRPSSITINRSSNFNSTSYILSSSYFGRAVSADTNNNGVIIFATGSAIPALDSATLNLTTSITFPKMSTVSTINYEVNDSVPGIFGISKGINQFVNEYSNLYHVDLFRPLGRSQFYEPTGSAFEYSYVFTLDDVSGSSNAAQAQAESATWATGSRYAGTSFTAVNGNGALPTGSLAYGTSLNFNRFMLGLHGGFDGIDVTEAEPFKNAAMSVSATEKNSYVYNSYKVAINTVKDPERVNMNLLAVPGLTNESLTKLVIDNCQSRGDALAIVDLTGDYKPQHENITGHTTVKPTNTRTVIANLRQRVINSSYAAAYFPWVKMQIADRAQVWVPPSVAAVGTLASAEKKNDVWFAPAGFNRGGLRDLDSRGKYAAGFQVLSTALPLTVKQRDDLYEANINPIANFVTEGIVVFGQKTLQIIPSALDRINVRRLLILVKKRISLIASGILFDQNVDVTWSRFKNDAEAFLSDIKARLGLTDYRVVLDSTTTTDELIDRNILYAKVFLQPARAIEFIAVDFIITRTGASFND